MSIIPRRLGKYELQQQLGQGSAGEVWKAYDAFSRQYVAIKLIHSDLQSDPNFMTHFMRDGQVLTTLQHANLVNVREVNIARQEQANETTAYLAQDYVEGQTLAGYISATIHKGIFPSAEQIVYLFTRLGTAIDYAHQHGFLHGNIKPSNILLDKYNAQNFKGGEPQISDFGLIQLVGNAVNIGSPLYMSPEQAKGHPITSRSDIYSLGVVLYEICTGVQPFRDESAVAIMMQHINTLPTPPGLINPNLPPKLSEVILRAMSKDAASRYARASLLATAIADACSLQSVLQAPDEEFTEREEEGLYARNGNTGPILGVSRPSQKLPAHILSARLLSGASGPLAGTSGPLLGGSRPLAGTSGPLLGGSRPLAGTSGPLLGATSQVAGTSGPLPGATSDYPAIRANSQFSAQPLHVPPSPQSESRIQATSMTGQTTRVIPASTPTNKIMVPRPVINSMMPQAMQTSSPLVPQPTPFPIQRRSSMTDTPVYIAFAALVLLLIVIAGAIGASVLFNNNQNAAPKGVSGHIFFQDDALGHNDQIHIEMQNVPAPASGKNYYFWLQNVNGQVQLLGQLPLQHGAISYIYAGDNQHHDLLVQTQSFSITQEDAAPAKPTGTSVYQASANPDTFPYIKNILYVTPGLPNNQSVVASLLDTIKSMNDKAGSINDSLQVQQDDALVRRQATRIIEMIDGTNYSMSSGDLPAQYQPQAHVHIGLFSSSQQQGYIDILATQLDNVKRVANGDSTLLQRVQNVQNALSDLRSWLQKIRMYDVQILKATALNSPAIMSAALQLKNTAADSYVGRTIPPAAAPQPVLGSAGAEQAYIEAQYMAALTIK